MEAKDYSTYTTDELLEALERAGRHPNLKLIRVIINQREATTPGLLAMLRKDLREDEWENWDNDDPRHYRSIHAGLLLIFLKEPEALPLFKEFLSYEEFDNYLEWFAPKLHNYGPVGVPVFKELLTDEDVWGWGRISAVERLGYVAAAYPEERASILASLRDQLPTLGEDGAPQVTGSVSIEDEEDDRVELWTDVAYALARLNDEESRPRIDALFEHDMIDTWVFGDQEDYHEILGSTDERDCFSPEPFDILTYYEDRARREAEREARRKQDRSRAQESASRVEGGTFVRDRPKVGRNDPCPCGSGRKYKHCCG